MFYSVKKALIVSLKIPFGFCKCSGIITEQNGVFTCQKCNTQYVRLSGYDSPFNNKLVKRN
jgi:hypothetical protein